jgi:hypothetical protein
MSAFEGVAIVGADALRSTIRQQMVREGEPRTIGFVAHRTIVPMSEVSADVRRNDVVLWSGFQLPTIPDAFEGYFWR